MNEKSKIMKKFLFSAIATVVLAICVLGVRWILVNVFDMPNDSIADRRHLKHTVTMVFCVIAVIFLIILKIVKKR